MKILVVLATLFALSAAPAFAQEPAAKPAAAHHAHKAKAAKAKAKAKKKKAAPAAAAAPVAAPAVAK